MEFKEMRLMQASLNEAGIEPIMYYKQVLKRDFSMEPHRNKSIECIISNKNNFVIEFYDENDIKSSVAVKPGEILIINTLVKHSIVVSEETTRINRIDFQIINLNKTNNFIISIPFLVSKSMWFADFIQDDWDYFIVDDNGDIEQIFSKLLITMLREENADEFDHSNKIMQQLLTYEFFLECSRLNYVKSKIIENKYIEAAKAYIEQNCDSEIKISKLAESVHISRGYLEQLSKKYLGISLTNYINQQRIAKAKELLISNKSSIMEVAFQVGFNNRQTFVRSFKKGTGYSPSEYRAAFTTKK